jgi:hypothetical protein
MKTTQGRPSKAALRPYTLMRSVVIALAILCIGSMLTFRSYSQHAAAQSSLSRTSAPAASTPAQSVRGNGQRSAPTPIADGGQPTTDSAASAACPLSMTIQTGRNSCTNGTIVSTFTSVGTSPVNFFVSYQSVQGAGNPTLSIQDNTGTFQTSSGTINGTGGNVNFTINQSSQTFTLTPTSSNITNATVNVKATDGSSTTTQTFTFWTGTAPPSNLLAVAEQQGSGQIDLYTLNLGASDSFTPFNVSTGSNHLVVTNSTNEIKPDIDNPRDLLFDFTGSLLIANGGQGGSDTGNFACVPVGAITNGAPTSVTNSTNANDPESIDIGTDSSVALGNLTPAATYNLSEYLLGATYLPAPTQRDITNPGGVHTFDVAALPTSASNPPGTFAAAITNGTNVSRVTIKRPDGTETDITDSTIVDPHAVGYDVQNNQLVIASSNSTSSFLDFYTVTTPITKVKAFLIRDDGSGHSQITGDKLAVSPDGHVAVGGVAESGHPEVQVYDNTSSRSPVGGPIPFDTTTAACGITFTYGSSVTVTSLRFLTNTKLLVTLSSSDTTKQGVYIYDISQFTAPGGFDSVSCAAPANSPTRTGFQNFPTSPPLATAFNSSGSTPFTGTGNPPSIAESFNPTKVAVCVTSTITFGINNPYASAINASFTDTLPTNLVVASTPNVVNGCGGSVTATAGSSAISYSNSNLSSGQCTIKVDVQASTDGLFCNSAQIKSTTTGDGNTASATLTVINPPAIAKAFGANAIPTNGTTSLTFTLSNANNTNSTLNGVAFTDNLPDGLVVASSPGLVNNCGGTPMASASSSTVSLSGASMAPHATCAVSVNVTGTTSGVKANSVTISSTNGGTGNTSSANLTVVDPPTISVHDAKVAEPSTGTASMLFTVTFDHAYLSTVTVNYATADGTAAAGQDYTTTTGTLTFPAGTTIQTISVPILHDGTNTTDETLLVNLSSPSNGSTIDTGQATGTITAANPPGTFLISELRTSGPASLGDDFVELYNNTDTPLIVTASDASAGYGVFKQGSDCNATPVLIATIPNGTVIPARGHYLVVGSQYSLSAYATGDQTVTSDIESDHNAAVFTTANVQNLSSAARLDAVGFGTNTGGAICDLLREGSTLPPVSGSTTEHSFFRKECDFQTGVGCTVQGTPKDTNDNSSDFEFADTQGTNISGVPRQLGAPGPENKTSPIRRDSTILVSLLDNTVSSAATPNRVRDVNATGTNAAFGTLSIRRRVTNQTGANVTRLRFRIVEVTTFPSPGAGVAELRALSSADVSGGVMVNDPGTCSPSSAPCTVVVRGTSLEQPPTQSGGGGVNSTLAVGVVNLAQPLAPNAAVNVQFLLGVQQTGTFRFLVITEALP